jgi:hypothetical protein
MSGRKRKLIWSKAGKLDHHSVKKRYDNPVAKNLNRNKPKINKVEAEYDRKNEKKEIEEELKIWE